MTIQNPYFDIVVNTSDKTFYIVDSASSKTRDPGSDCELLRKMEMIMKSKFTYDPNHPDTFSGLSSVQLFTLFQEQAGKIRERCLTEEASWSFLKRKVFSNEEAINTLYQKIMECKPHPSREVIKPIMQKEATAPKDLIGMVTDYYSNEDIIALESTSKENAEVRAAAERAIIKRAKEYGYKPRRYTKDVQGALRHLRAVMKIIKNPSFLTPLARHIPKIAAYDDKELNVEKTISNLQNLSNEELIAILRNPDIARTLPEEFFELFVGRILNVSSADQASINRTFITAIKERPPLIHVAKFLLEQGANPHHVFEVDVLIFGAYEHRVTSVLRYCITTNPSIEMIKLLLKHGCSINERGPLYSTTPLEDVCSSFTGVSDRFRELIPFLVENGAEINIKEENGFNPLYHLCKGEPSFVFREDRLWAIEFLLKNGAKPSLIPEYTYIKEEAIIKMLERYKQNG